MKRQEFGQMARISVIAGSMVALGLGACGSDGGSATDVAQPAADTAAPAPDTQPNDVAPAVDSTQANDTGPAPDTAVPVSCTVDEECPGNLNLRRHGQCMRSATGLLPDERRLRPGLFLRDGDLSAGLHIERGLFRGRRMQHRFQYLRARGKRRAPFRAARTTWPRPATAKTFWTVRSSTGHALTSKTPTHLRPGVGVDAVTSTVLSACPNVRGWCVTKAPLG